MEKESLEERLSNLDALNEDLNLNNERFESYIKSLEAKRDYATWESYDQIKKGVEFIYKEVSSQKNQTFKEREEITFTLLTIIEGLENLQMYNAPWIKEREDYKTTLDKIGTILDKLKNKKDGNYERMNIIETRLKGLKDMYSEEK